MRATLTLGLTRRARIIGRRGARGTVETGLEAIAWQVFCWEQGEPDGQQFPRRVAEEPLAEMRPVLELLNEKLQKRGLKAGVAA